MRLPGLVRANIFSLFGLPVASIGLIPSENQCYEAVSKGEQDDYRCIYIRGDQLIGAVLMGDVTDAGLIRQLIGERPVGNRSFRGCKTGISKDYFTAFGRR